MVELTLIPVAFDGVTIRRVTSVESIQVPIGENPNPNPNPNPTFGPGDKTVAPPNPGKARHRNKRNSTMIQVAAFLP